MVAAVIGGVALLDVVTGAYVCLAPDPSGANGVDALWSSLAGPLEGDDEHARAMMSLFRRAGVLQLFAGLTTAMWLVYGLVRDRAAITLLLISYAIIGLAIAAVDRAYFAGTPYFWFKQGVGALWFIALAVELHSKRAAKTASDLDNNSVVEPPP